MGPPQTEIKILTPATRAPYVNSTPYDLHWEGVHQGSTTMRRAFSYVVLTSDMPLLEPSEGARPSAVCECRPARLPGPAPFASPRDRLCGAGSFWCPFRTSSGPPCSSSHTGPLKALLGASSYGFLCISQGHGIRLTGQSAARRCPPCSVKSSDDRTDARRGSRRGMHRRGRAVASLSASTAGPPTWARLGGLLRRPWISPM